MSDFASNDQSPIRGAWNQIRTVYRFELLGALREKTIVINSILIPIFLYPLIMWAAFSALSFIQGQSEKSPSRVGLANLPTHHPRLRAELERNRKIHLFSNTGAAGVKKVAAGSLDAVVEFVPVSGAGGELENNFKTIITFSAARDASVRAKERIQDAVDEYRKVWLQREAAERGIDTAAWQGFGVKTQNVASEKQMGGFVLGLMLPMLFVVMVAAGCFYPAIDCTAGERERSTWETLMASAATRGNIVIAKYLYVTTLGGMAGALNLLAFAITIKPIFAPLLAEAGTSLNFSVPMAAIPLLMLAALLLAGFVAAGMMIFAAFARTFKEGQGMIMPFYLLVLLPPMFLQIPGLKFSLWLACVPVINVTMMVRSLVSGAFPWLQIGVTILVSICAIAICIRAAAFILNFEEVMVGAYAGSWRRFLKERIFRRADPTKNHIERQT